MIFELIPRNAELDRTFSIGSVLVPNTQEPYVIKIEKNMT